MQELWHFRGMGVELVLLWRSQENRWGATDEAPWGGQMTPCANLIAFAQWMVQITNAIGLFHMERALSETQDWEQCGIALKGAGLRCQWCLMTCHLENNSLLFSGLYFSLVKRLGWTWPFLSEIHRTYIIMHTCISHLPDFNISLF